MDKLIDYTADIQSSSLDFASSLRQLQTLSKVTRRKHSNLIPEDSNMIRTKDMVIAAKRTTAAQNVSSISGRKSPYKFEILKTAKTSLMVPPSSDEKIVELFNLPKNSKIVTNDGQSPFASFFTTGWFEPEPAVPEFIEFETMINRNEIIEYENNVKLTNCRTNDHFCHNMQVFPFGRFNKR